MADQWADEGEAIAALARGDPVVPTGDVRPWRLAALVPLPPEALHGLVAGLPVELLVPAARDSGAVREVLADAELVLGDWSGGLGLGAAEAAAAGRLAFVQQPGVGVERIDLAAFAERDIPVANTAGVNAVSVAEWCLAATISVLRRMGWADRQVRAGGWPQLELIRRGSGELAGRRVGVVGLGAVGDACARRFVAMGCEVSYWSRRRRTPEEEGGLRYRALDELLGASEVLVVAVALTPDSYHLLNAERLAKLPAGAYLVNVARGDVVDEAALADALAQGRLAGAALDVYAVEPLPADSPLRAMDDVLLSPHAGGATVQAAGRTLQRSVDNLRAAVSGQPVRSVVNGVDPVVRRRD